MDYPVNVLKSFDTINPFAFYFIFSRVELRNYVFCSRFPIRLMRIRNKSLQMFSLHKLKHDTTTKLVCSHWLYVYRYPHSHTSFLLKWFHTKYHVSQILSWENVFMCGYVNQTIVYLSSNLKHVCRTVLFYFWTHTFNEK